MNRLTKLLISFAGPFLAGGIGSAFTTSAIPTWYAGLQKPSFNPPNSVFGPVWTTLYVLMGISLYRIWVSSAPNKEKHNLLSVFTAQLVLNAFWSIGFFGLESPATGLLIIIPLWVCIAWLIVRTWKFDKIAAAVLIPYICWVSFATILNFAIWRLN